MKIKNFPIVLAAILLTTVGVIAQQTTAEPSAERLQKDVSYLASDKLEGRRAGTAGADEAARYIANEFSRLGLRPASSGEAAARYLQRFPYVAGVELGKSNALMLRMNDAHMSLKAGTDWMPLGFSPNATIENTKAVFVGYGITASELNYNDYSNPKVAGRVAIALSGSPDGDNPHGRFGRYEDVRWKAIAARNAGAIALIVIARADKFSEDRLSRLRYDNSGESGIPVIVISRQAAKDLQLNKPVSELEEAAKSKSDAAYADVAWSITLDVNVVRREVPAYNVIGILEGSDPVLKNEHIVIGAHYDHLGRGGEGSGSLAPTSGEIHHGADDNASGTAGLLELARTFSAQRTRLKRSFVFIAFGAEEEGLLGSNYYVNHPAASLANTVAMINMDMIGRMRDRKLSIGGVGTASEWREIIKEANTAQTVNVTANPDAPPPASPPVGTPTSIPIVVSANGRTIMTVDPKGAFELSMSEDGLGPSDHSSFYLKQIPVLFFFTGAHSDYHKPSDTFEKINYNDEARILRLITRILIDVDEADKRPTYVKAKSDPTVRTGGFRVYIGTIPNYADSTNGLLIDGVREDSPAAKAGIKAGDRIVKIGEREVKNVYDYTFALGEMKAGQEYVFEVMRGDEKLSLKVTPAEGRR